MDDGRGAPDYERRALALVAVVGIVLVIRGSVSPFSFGLVTWQVALYVASVAPLAVSAALCGLVLMPETWRARWSWTRRPPAELLLGAVLAFVGALLVTAGAFIAAAIAALGNDTPFG